MRKKNNPSISNVSTSLANSENGTDYEFLKVKNNELCKELTALKKHRAEMQMDMDYIIREKLELEFRHNHVKQIVGEIDKRSKIFVNKIIEWSNEMSIILRLTKKVEEYYNSPFATPKPSPKNKNSGFKQVVAPHAVNGHVIHNPTIRIARYNEGITEDLNSNNEEQNNHEDSSSSEEEVPNNNEDDGNANTTFKSRGRMGSSSLNPADLLNQLDEAGDEEISGGEEEEEEQENEEEEETENESKESRRRLSTIEEKDASTNEEEEDHPVFSGRFQEVKIYLTQLPSTSTINNSKETTNTFSSSQSTLKDDPDSSINVEASTSINRTDIFNSTTQDQTERRFSIPSGSKRKSFAERKALGSPIPPKINTNNIISRRSSGSSSQTMQSPTTSLCSTKNSRRSLTFHPEESASSMSELSTLNTLIEHPSIHSTPLYTETRLPIFDSRNSSTEFLRNKVSDRRHVRSRKADFVAKVELASLESSQTSLESSQTLNSSTLKNIENSKQVLKVELTRMNFSKEEIQNSEVRLSNVSPELEKSLKRKNKLLKNKVKKEKSVKKRKTVSKENKPSLNPIVREVKRENSPSISEESDSGSLKRPRRAATPLMSFKEVSILKKMRRE